MKKTFFNTLEAEEKKQLNLWNNMRCMTVNINQYKKKGLTGE
jgi:hypothetical protein